MVVAELVVVVVVEALWGLPYREVCIRDGTGSDAGADICGCG